MGGCLSVILQILRVIGLTQSQAPVHLFAFDNAVPGVPQFDKLERHMKNHLLHFRQHRRYYYVLSISTRSGELMICNEHAADGPRVKRRLGIKCAKSGHKQDIREEGRHFSALRGCAHIPPLLERRTHNPYLILDVGDYRTLEDSIPNARLTDAELWSMFLCCTWRKSFSLPAFITDVPGLRPCGPRVKGHL